MSAPSSRPSPRVVAGSAARTGFLRAFASHLSRRGMQVLDVDDPRLGRLAGAYDVVAARWDSERVALVACFDPDGDDDPGGAAVRQRIAALLAWGARELDLRPGVDSCDLLLVATRPLAPLDSAVTDFGDVHAAVAWVDVTTCDAGALTGRASGVPSAAVLARLAEQARAAAAAAAGGGGTERRVAVRDRRSGGMPSPPAARRRRADAAVDVRAPEALLPSVLSLGLSLFVVAGLSSWPVAGCVAAMVAIHEAAHLLAAAMLGLRSAPPLFIGPFGGLARVGLPETARARAVVALAGPAAGVAASLCCLAASGAAGPDSTAGSLLLAAARWGCVVNLVGLIPAGVLDGAAVVRATSRWTLGLLSAGAAALSVFSFVTADADTTAIPAGAAALVAAFLALRGGRRAWERRLAASLRFNVAVAVVVAAALAGSVVRP